MKAVLALSNKENYKVWEQTVARPKKSNDIIAFMLANEFMEYFQQRLLL